VDDLDDPTPEQIERARLIGLFERSEFEREADCKLDADGRIQTKKPDGETSGSTDTFER